MGFLFGIIGSIFTGAVVGLGGRAILPGAQDIGMLKTVLLGIVSSVLVGVIFNSLIGDSWIVGVIIGSVAAAGLLWLGIRQGFLKPEQAKAA